MNVLDNIGLRGKCMLSAQAFVEGLYGLEVEMLNALDLCQVSSFAITPKVDIFPWRPYERVCQRLCKAYSHFKTPTRSQTFVYTLLFFFRLQFN